MVAVCPLSRVWHDKRLNPSADSAVELRHNIQGIGKAQYALG